MKTLEEMLREGDELVREIEELEGEQELNDFGSVSYDFVDAEIQSLGLKLDTLMKEIKEYQGQGT